MVVRVSGRVPKCPSTFTLKHRVGRLMGAAFYCHVGACSVHAIALGEDAVTVLAKVDPNTRRHNESAESCEVEVVLQ